MRPTRLELRGFTAFREAVTVDFQGADLFAIAGPTGAGKSTLIDAMCFALYGSVPRLDRRTVAPVIASGVVEARVRFDFTVAERAFTAVRVVRRLSGGGATTKEARLESAGEVLAGDADAVTAGVERVLGLGFDQFTKCVVLPQGEFQRFLHDRPSGRQDLLVRLLEMDVYARMRGEANSRRQVAESSAELVHRRLQELAGATPQALAAAGERITRLAALRDEIDAARPRLDALTAAQTRAAAAAAEASANCRRLSGLLVPDGVAALTSTAAELDNAATEAAATADVRAAAVEEAEEVRDALGEEGGLQHLRSAHQQRAQQTDRLTKGEPILADRRRAQDEAEVLVRAAVTRVEGAADALEAARRDHAAHTLTATLVAGEPCPVCGQPVSAVPGREAPPALSVAQAALVKAQAALRPVEDALATARDARVKAEQTLDSVRERLSELDEVLVDTLDPAEVEHRLREIGEADAALVTAREAERAARRAAREAADAARTAGQRRDRAWSGFDSARDKVAASGPPAVRRDDLAGAWAALAEWSRGEASAQEELAEAQRDAASTAQDQLEAVAASLNTRCQECEVIVAAGKPARDAAADALAAAKVQCARIESELAEAQRLRDEGAGHSERAEVARALAGHLAANRFEQWLLDEALQRLAEGASVTLRELSAGQYSLAMDDQRNFVVIDHGSADERRPARTLSGGETFLASFSLALTLADHLAALAVDTEPRLESIFLDEGFGTLDPEALDTVAAAIEELGARGRTVGLVTHVRDLAERLPIRYEVRRGPAGSTVERVER